MNPVRFGRYDQSAYWYLTGRDAARSSLATYSLGNCTEKCRCVHLGSIISTMSPSAAAIADSKEGV